jgi:putative hydrolase
VIGFCGWVVGMDPVSALKQIALFLERSGAPTQKVRAFRRAAQVVADLPRGDVEKRAAAGTLTALPGIGNSTAKVIKEAVAGGEPEYLTELLASAGGPVQGGEELRAALKGDCHTHSDWSDGGSPIREMAEAAIKLGHEWMALTDHSPRLRVAHGLSADRLRRQLDLVAELNAELAPFRILTGIEVDILDDGALDQRPDLLAELDVVVASVHSKLRMPRREMTRRMVAAVSNPMVDILGHCTGRLVTGKGRPESEFDADEVFGACVEHGVAVEINSRPERLDPPRRLLKLAVARGCDFAIDSDAHAPGQLHWLPNGCARAQECGVTADRVVNTRTADALLAGFQS